MKKALRAITATMLVLAFAAVATFALTANADAAPTFENNLTAGATATAGSYYNNQENRDPEGAIDGVIDGSVDNYWQAATGDSTAFDLEWATAQTFDTIVIRWKTGSKTTLDKVTVGGQAVGYDAVTYDGDITVISITSASSTKVGFAISGTFNSGCGDFPGEIVEVEVYNAAHGNSYEVGEGGDNNQGGADTGVASTLGFAVVAVAAAAVALKSKKNAD